MKRKYTYNIHTVIEGSLKARSALNEYMALPISR